MKSEFIEDVYRTMRGTLVEEYRIPGVEDAFAPGSVCAVARKSIYDAARRLDRRLGSVEDADVEEIINAFLDIQEELCYRMYCCGAKFGIRE